MTNSWGFNDPHVLVSPSNRLSTLVREGSIHVGLTSLLTDSLDETSKGRGVFSSASI